MSSDEPADGKNLRVRDRELDYDEELIYTYRGEKFTGIGYDDVPGRGVSEISYKDGLQDGPARDWYASGVLKGESMYRQNLLHGRVREFRQDGSIICNKKYEYGFLVEDVEYDESENEISRYSLSERSPNYARLERIREHFSWR